MLRARSYGWTVYLALATAIACADSSRSASLRRGPSLAQAEQAFRARAPDAYQQYIAIAANSSDGRLSRARLAEADAHYLRALRYMHARDPRGRDEMQAGLAIAPINPAHYLALARVYRELGLLERAEKYYGKYLRALSSAADATAVRAELAALGPLQQDPLEEAGPPSHLRSSQTSSPFAIGLFALGFCVIGLSVVLVVARRGMTLDQLVVQRPQLDVAVAYLVSALRHEFLKHRIGAVHGLLARLGPEGLSTAQQTFLSQRLLSEPRLGVAWRAHLDGFRSALDPRLSLRRDPRFRRAQRAITQLEALAPALNAPKAGDLHRIECAYRELELFDAYLVKLLERLARARLDRALIMRAWQEVRAEHSAGGIDVTDFRCPDAEPELFVRAFAADLLLALKNLLRNAVLAVGEQPTDRHIAVLITTSVEPTGEELIQLHVLDSGATPLPPDALLAPDLRSGLGLVAAAVTRYGGGMNVDSAEPPFTKRVVLKLFRAEELSSEQVRT